MAFTSLWQFSKLSILNVNDNHNEKFKIMIGIFFCFNTLYSCFGILSEITDNRDPLQETHCLFLGSVTGDYLSYIKNYFDERVPLKITPKLTQNHFYCDTILFGSFFDKNGVLKPKMNKEV